MSRLKSILLNETRHGLVSVLIPAYNHENYVQETIRSILAQTFQEIELLIIDDGSKDSTWEKINELKPECEARFRRVEFLTQKNCGITETLNRLISLAQGEFLYLIASDDAACPEAIQTEFDFLNSHHEYALVVGDNYIMDENGKRCAMDPCWNLVPLNSENSFQTFAELLQTARQMNFTSKNFTSYSNLFFGNYVPNGYLIRKSIFSRFGAFTKEAPLEDFYLMLQIVKFAKIKYLDKPLFYYRRHSKNTSSNVLMMEKITKATRNFEKITWEQYYPLKCLGTLRYLYAQTSRKSKHYLIQVYNKLKIRYSNGRLHRLLKKIYKIPKRFFK